jgi:hypothetical protein
MFRQRGRIVLRVPINLLKVLLQDLPTFVLVLVNNLDGTQPLSKLSALAGIVSPLSSTKFHDNRTFSHHIVFASNLSSLSSD